MAWFGAEAWSWVKGAAETVGESALDVVKAVPGSEELAKAIGPLITGPLRDVANHPAGKIVLRAMSTTIYGPLAWEIGPQVASVAFALPGLARGQDFWHAWFDEVRWRAETTAEIVAPGAADQAIKGLHGITPALSELFPEGFAAMVPIEEAAARLGISPEFALEELGKRLGISAWDAAMVRVAMFPDIFDPPNRDDFNPLTGDLKPSRRAPSRSAVAALQIRQATGWEPPNVLLARTSLALTGDVAGARPWTAPSVFEAAPPVELASDASDTRRRNQDLLLAGVIVAAVGSFVWWYRGQEKRSS